jgi:hypothetical protein
MISSRSIYQDIDVTELRRSRKRRMKRRSNKKVEKST